MQLTELHTRSRELLREVQYLIDEFMVETGATSVEFYKTSENELGIRIENKIPQNWKIKDVSNESPDSFF